MRGFYVKPKICRYDTFREFAKEFEISSDDLLITHEFIYNDYLKSANIECDYIFQEQYGTGEPSSEMIDRMLAEMKRDDYKRIIAIGGGTVIDIAKLFSLEKATKVSMLFDKTVLVRKCRQLVIIPTTCGTGSEVTNLSIIEVVERKTKVGLVSDDMFADYAILIPKLVKSLPYMFFLYSSIDALIHAVESFVAPKSNEYTELFSIKAIEKIIKGYKKILKDGAEARFELLEDFLIASNFAGIAFGNTGVGAVHAVSYPLGGNYHVPHGEANYQFFIEVFKLYEKKKPEGKIKELIEVIADNLGVEKECVFERLEEILNGLIDKKNLKEYGMKESEIEEFADSVIKNQQRLLANNYVNLSRDEIRDIYRNLY